MFVNYICKSLIMLVLDLVAFPIIFPVRFITFPIPVFSFCFKTVKKILVRACTSFYSCLISFLYSHESHLIKAATRFRRAVLSSLYVFLVLLVLLVSCFAISGVVVAVSTEAPFFMTQTLNFDYTKTNPCAIVPLTSSRFTGPASGNTTSPSYGFGKRHIAYNNKMRLVVSLTLPESEYNRQLGIFQVRVESLSVNGDVIVGSSYYPTMLRFKSEAVRAIERSIKIMSGLKSEVQNVRVVVEDRDEFGEGGNSEAITGFKVSLEKRAEVEDGYGVPEIYGGSLEISSKLPLLKRMVWNWRLTIFVWIGFISFLAELMIVLLFCRSVLLRGIPS